MQNKIIAMPKSVEKILHTLSSNGFEGYIVGGCVRDSLLGKEPHDWDICTDATPEEVQQLFKSCLLVGVSFGTVIVNINKESFEVTTYRNDGKYTDGRKPDSVTFATTLREDINRRDLTINGIAYNDTEGIVDYVGGLKDIADKKIRFIGNAYERMTEDYLRSLRALRFEMSLYGFSMSSETKNLCKQLFKDNYSKLSIERIQAEINKVLSVEIYDDTDKLSEFFKLIADTVIPEIKPIVGLDQKNRYHCYDAFEHTIHVVTGTKPVLETRWAALLHDLGKAEAMTIDDNGYGHFYGHQEISARLADVIMKNMKFSNNFRNIVVDLVLNHDEFKNKENKINRMKLRKFMSKRTPEFMYMLSDLRYSDTLAHINNESLIENQHIFDNRVREIQGDGSAITLKEMKVNGNILSKELGIPKSPIMKEVLDWLLHCCHAHPSDNNREWLLAEAAREYKRL